ncbi:amastin-like protein [Novymonas esmeraldas]|uniref:Amastin-like protein n=1 Tax=Novymonas esmeraldas TaxID=1808958 RepID=A0AAW0EWG0_9TRYP
MCNDPCHVGLVIYLIVQFIAFLFILVGTPIDQFRVQNTEVFSNNPCLTVWGWKRKCISATWDVSTNNYWSGCPERRTRFRAAEALTIVAIGISALAFIFGLFMLCCCRCMRWLCLILNILATGSGCAVTALMIDAFYNNHESGLRKYNNSCYALRETGSIVAISGTTVATHFKYGAGFALYIVGWGLCFINIIFLMLPC